MASKPGKARSAAADIAFCAMLVAGGAVALRELGKTAHAPFDPLGSATVPTVLVWIVIGLAAIIAARGLLGRPAGGVLREEDRPPTAAIGRRRVLQVGAILALTVLYVFSITHALAPFSVSTALLMTASTLTLAGRRGIRPVLAIALALIVGIGGEILFTRVFHLPLPGF